MIEFIIKKIKVKFLLKNLTKDNFEYFYIIFV